jgi:ribosome maturation factor RimP
MAFVTYELSEVAMSLNRRHITPSGQLGFRLWDIKVTKAGKRSIVSVTLDKHNGATLEDISQASKEIAPV